MNNDLNTSQRKDWEEFYTSRMKALHKLHEDEWLVRKQFGLPESNMPEEWQRKLLRERQAWTEEWSMTGHRYHQLQEKHTLQNDRQDKKVKQQTEQILQDRHSDLQAVEDSKILAEKKQTTYKLLHPQNTDSVMNDFYDRNPGYAYRDAHWDELLTQHDLIRKHYHILGEPVPLATERRMAMHIDQFRQTWDGIAPELKNEEWQTLDRQDLQNEFKSWQDLVQSQRVIEKYYGPDVNIPEQTALHMNNDVKQFWKEMDAYKAKLAEQDKPSQTQDFKQQVQELQAKKRHSMKPRMG